MEHRIEKDILHDCPQSPRPGPLLDGFVGDGGQSFVSDHEVNRLHLEQPLVLRQQRVLGLGEDELEGAFRQGFPVS